MVNLPICRSSYAQRISSKLFYYNFNNVLIPTKSIVTGRIRPTVKQIIKQLVYTASSLGLNVLSPNSLATNYDILVLRKKIN